MTAQPWQPRRPWTPPRRALRREGLGPLSPRARWILEHSMRRAERNPQIGVSMPVEGKLGTFYGVVFNEK